MLNQRKNRTRMIASGIAMASMTLPAVWAGTSASQTPLPQSVVMAALGQNRDLNQQVNRDRDRNQQVTFISGNRLIGMQVQSSDGQPMGEIEEVLIDPKSGEIEFAVISSSSGLLDSTTYRAVPWSKFSTNQDADNQDAANPNQPNAQPNDQANAEDMHPESLMLNVTQEELEEAESFESDQWPNTSDEDWQRETNEAFGVENSDSDGPDVRNDQYRPSEEDGQRQQREGDSRNDNSDTPDTRRDAADENESADDDAEPDSPDRRNSQYRPGDDADADSQSDQNQRDQRQADRQDRDQRQSDREDRDQRQGDRAAQNQGSANDAQASSNRLSEMIGNTVRDAEGESVGEVEDIIFDLEQDKASYAKVGFGGTLGFGEDMVYVPFDQLKMHSESNTFAIAMTEDELMQMEKDQPDDLKITSTSFEESVSASFDSDANQNERDNEAAYAGDWQKDRDYDQNEYDQSSEQTISGEIVSVGTYRSSSDAPAMTRLRVSADNGQTYVVHVAPRDHLWSNGVNFHNGDQVEITGSSKQLSDREVLMARDLTIEAREVQLRDQDGKPTWDSE